MIKGTFKIGGDLIDVVVKQNNLFFWDSNTQMTTTIEGLKLSKAGVIKEHPDLENDEEWKKKAIDRLKEHIKKFNTEDEKLNYIKSELTKHGYEPKFKQKAGWRTTKL